MATLTPELLIDTLVTEIQAVDGIGAVYNRRRQVKNEDDVKTLLVRSQVLNAVFVTWTGLPDTMTDGGRPGSIGALSTFTFGIELLYGLNDAQSSEVTFRILLWNIAQRFNTRGNVAAAVGASFQERLRIDEIAYLELAGIVLVHFARMAISFRGRVSP